MIKFFRKIRKKLLVQNKISRYVIYALGEILLVVVGILIAIKINDWNREKVLLNEEKETYHVIIADLKRDSVLFDSYKSFYNLYLDTYFKLNAIKNGEGHFKGIMTDFIVSNVEFNPVVQRNNLPIIAKLRNKSVRNQINSYFRRLNQLEQATNEFNKLIAENSRPFFIEEHDILNNATVFDYEDRTFPPYKRVSTVDTTKLALTMPIKYFTPIISELRMSMGFYLSVLDRGLQENHELISELESLIND